MRILFVSSGNSKDGINSIIKNQAESLIEQGIVIDYFTIKGRGIWSYLRHIFILHNYIRTNKFDIVHAHYSFSGYVASLAGSKPTVVSLMGSDVKSGSFAKYLLRWFSFGWSHIIVKSEDMRNGLKMSNVDVIPNGVDLIRFKPIDKAFCQGRLNWDFSRRHVLFAANPNRLEKNFQLALDTFSLMNDQSVELHFLDNVSNAEIPIWLNASDVVLLTSKWEGSPNVVKEAMACERPVISTDVGDVKWLFGQENGHYIVCNDPVDVKSKLLSALDYSQVNLHTQGRKRLLTLGIDSDTIANRIIELYGKILQK